MAKNCTTVAVGLVCGRTRLLVQLMFGVLVVLMAVLAVFVAAVVVDDIVGQQ